MKPSARLLYTCISLFAFTFNTAYGSETPPGFADLVEKLTPSVVNISSTQKVKSSLPDDMLQMPDGSDMPPEFRDFLQQFMGQGGKPVEHEVYALGSGFIIDENGYIATNNHVIDEAEDIEVTLSDNTKLKAKVIGRDPKTDLALLKVNSAHKLPAAILGDSDKSRVGDWVIAIGNPFGLGGTVTAGIISARARNINAGPFDDFIQTDAAINRGNSGGPMFNMKGEVIGINTAIFSPSGGSIGIGFAIPASLAKSVFAQLKSTGHIDRGWLGVKIQEVTDEIADSVKLSRTYGTLVSEVAKGGPADKAGIRDGDVIIGFDGKEVKDMHSLPRMVADTSIGRTVPVQLWRDGKTLTVNVRIGEMKEDEESEGKGTKEKEGEQSKKGKEILGLTLSPISETEREKYSIAPDLKGVLVRDVKPDSDAAKSGVVVGDVIVQAGSTAVSSVKDVSAAASEARKNGRKYLLLKVVHGQDTLFVTVSLDEK